MLEHWHDVDHFFQARDVPEVVRKALVKLVDDTELDAVRQAAIRFFRPELLGEGSVTVGTAENRIGYIRFERMPPDPLGLDESLCCLVACELDSCCTELAALTIDGLDQMLPTAGCLERSSSTHPIGSPFVSEFAR